MDVESCILGRRSVRRYKPGRVSEEVVRHGIELANAAPSAGNLQAREFVVVRDPETRMAMSKAALGQTEMTEADVAVVFCANLKRIESYGRRGSELYVIQDVSAAVENFLLYIHSQGLGGVWVGAFDEAAMSKALDLPAHIRPLAIVPVGIPGEVVGPPKRRPVEETIHREKWEG